MNNTKLDTVIAKVKSVYDGDAENLDIIIHNLSKVQNDGALDKILYELETMELNGEAKLTAVNTLYKYMHRLSLFTGELAQCQTKKEIQALVASNNDILNFLNGMIDIDAILK